VGGIISEWRAASFRNRGRLRPESAHGYWDGDEREFRGFGRVEQRDSETFASYRSRKLSKPLYAEMFSPPVLTKTWFQLGPVELASGQDWQELDFADEWWTGDPVLLNHKAGVDAALAGISNITTDLTRRDRRHALRSLRGSVLRTEMYALDGSDRQSRPYTVAEGAFVFAEVENPLAASTPDIYRVFFPHPVAQRTTQWERGDDPMTAFTFTGDFDAFGQPRRKTQVGCPRGWRSASDVPSEPYLATRTLTVYATPPASGPYIFDRIARVDTFEYTTPPHSRQPTIFALRDLADNDQGFSRIGQVLNFYDREPAAPASTAFIGLPFGQVGEFGALVRTETLAFTEDIFNDAYKSGTTLTSPPEQPPYLNATPTWTDEYPAEFCSLTPSLAGYAFQDGAAGSPYARGFFAATARHSYDFHDPATVHPRGLVHVKRDPIGRDTTIAYDTPYSLLPVLVTDAAKLSTTVTYDYRVLQPALVTDQNGNQVLFTYTPLGLLASKAVGGNPAKTEGDRSRTSLQLEYDFVAQPIFVRTTRYCHHDTEMDVPLPAREQTIDTVEYSDGFGRLLQTRAQAADVVFGNSTFGDAGLSVDPSQPIADAVGVQTTAGGPPNVLVSGWQIYNNKGWVVEKYEPFFSKGWAYARPIDSQMGEKVILFYEPSGHVIRTVNPDGSEQRVVYGVPGSIAEPVLTNPNVFEPTPWEAYIYDANDNAGRTHPSWSTSYSNHWNTPASVLVDALGRNVASVKRNGSWPAPDSFTTRSTYDVRGNLLTVVDPLGRIAFSYTYDLLNRTLRVESPLDAGTKRSVLDAGGNVLERRDSKGALVLNAYDALNRPIRMWARDGVGQPMSLRERLIYGDSPDSGLADAAGLNLLGRLYLHYDEAGQLALGSYDFKGNILELRRRCLSDAVLLKPFTPPPPNWAIKPFRVDWQPPPGVTLDAYADTLLDPAAAVYTTSFTYDALNRSKVMLYPEDVTGTRRQLTPRYDHAGALEGLSLDGGTYVDRICYTAKGQRVLISYGNGLMTRYAYDPQTFRLLRLRTEAYAQAAPLTYHAAAASAPLQDFVYEYDLVGNITGIINRTPRSGVLNNPQAVGAQDAALSLLLASGDALIRRFIYDPLYRLVSAIGRECKDIPSPRPWSDDPRCSFGNSSAADANNAPSLTSLYSELYTPTIPPTTWCSCGMGHRPEAGRDLSAWAT
jgi:hypothetical protein